MLSAWRAARGDLASALKSKLGGHAGRLFGGKMLIAIQVGLSLVLLVGAALFVRTLANLRAQPLGFRADHLLLFELDASASGYEGRRLLDFYARVADDVARLPGVRAGSMSRHGLLTGGGTRDTIGVSGASQGHDRIPVSVHFVAPRYFDTMGIELLTGRDFSDADREGARRTAIVNRALAELLVSGGMPIGRVVQYEGPQPDVEIVGVAADARFASLREPSPPTIYLPYRQYPQHRMTFALRVEGDWRAVVAPARRAIEAIDPVVPMFQVRTQEEQIADATRQERVFAYASSALATLAVLLACLGIYGTLAYAVSRRTSEIGVRMALGAARVQVVAMIVRESLAPVVVGVVAGGTAAWLSAGVLESMLFGVAPHDVPTLLCVTLGLLVSAIVAASVPARRASRIDPVDALRSE
jgi:predicted permease